MRAAYAVSWKVGPNLSAVTGRMTITPSGFVFLRLRERNRAYSTRDWTIGTEIYSDPLLQVWEGNEVYVYNKIRSCRNGGVITTREVKWKEDESKVNSMDKLVLGSSKQTTEEQTGKRWPTHNTMQYKLFCGTVSHCMDRGIIDFSLVSGSNNNNNNNDNNNNSDRICLFRVNNPFGYNQLFPRMP